MFRFNLQEGLIKFTVTSFGVCILVEVVILCVLGISGFCIFRVLLRVQSSATAVANMAISGLYGLKKILGLIS